MNGYAGEGAGKWILDLTNTALFSLLAAWGTEFEQVTAICDQSKPLSDDQTLFNVMINRKDKQYSLLDKKTPITFNLSGPIQLVDSKLTPGVQLADCVAAAFAYACSKDTADDYAIKWRSYIDSTVIYGSVFADLNYVDLDKQSVQRNAIVLIELVERTKRGLDLLEGMTDYVAMVSEALIYNPIKIPR